MAPTKSGVLASRAMHESIHRQFTDVSGDVNPRHVDPVASRRTQAGAPVVHGVHTLLWALESYAASCLSLLPVVRIRTKFLRLVYIGETLWVRVVAQEQNETTIQVEIADTPVMSAKLQFGDPDASTGEVKGPPQARSDAPHARDFQEMTGLAGDVFTSTAEDASMMFPATAAWLGAAAVAEMMACSYVVGMEAPGAYSMFSKLDMTLLKKCVRAARPALHFAVMRADERFSKVIIATSGTATRSTIEAFMRDKPVVQASMEEVAAHVKRNEFLGVRALVVGGSRGLGEVTARLIAAGGGISIITYSQGKVDAEALADDIRSWGGAVNTLAYDVRRPAIEQLAGVGDCPTHLFYFATGPIFKPKFALFSPDVLGEFLQFYVNGFYDLCETLSRTFTDSAIKVFYPSSTALDERPVGMTEYSMAKVAGEELCADMNRHMPGMQIFVARLPKLATDQTAGVLPDRSISVSEFMLGMLRDMNT